MIKKHQNARCAWVTKDQIYIDYHDKEWGIPVYNNHQLFEFLILEGAQAGLSWLTVLKKRANYRACFDNFEPHKIACYNQDKINELLNNPGIIRNRLKIGAAVINAQAYLKLMEEGTDFSEYLWRFVDGQPIKNRWINGTQVPSKTSISDCMAKELKSRGFKFVGSTICYAFMQAVGMVNDHTVDCICYSE
ncbi:MAG: DNA-3-methyladenine glycosylase I [Legionellales bacterium]